MAKPSQYCNYPLIKKIRKGLWTWSFLCGKLITSLNPLIVVTLFGFFFVWVLASCTFLWICLFQLNFYFSLIFIVHFGFLLTSWEECLVKTSTNFVTKLHFRLVNHVVIVSVTSSVVAQKQSCCCCWVTSVVSDSVRPHRWQPTRLPRPWHSPGKNTGVGCHFLLQCMKVKSEGEVAQSCPTQQPHGLQPTRLLRLWDFPGKSTGVGCHCLLWKAAIGNT